MGSLCSPSTSATVVKGCGAGRFLAIHLALECALLKAHCLETWLKRSKASVTCCSLHTCELTCALMCTLTRVQVC